jgi:hypothetical protein
MKRIRERFEKNWDGFWDQWKVVVVFFYIALLADAISTIHFMRHEGIDSELHPMVNLAAQCFGPIAGPLIGAALKAVSGLVVAVFWRRIAGFIFGIVSIISVWAAWYNLWGHRIYLPAIQSWWPF